MRIERKRFSDDLPRLGHTGLGGEIIGNGKADTPPPVGKTVVMADAAPGTTTELDDGALGIARSLIATGCGLLVVLKAS
jgi:hypothetical protein